MYSESIHERTRSGGTLTSRWLPRLVATVLLTGVACTNATQDETQHSQVARNGVMTAMQTRLSHLDRAKWFTSLAEAWPTEENKKERGSGATLAVVRGSIVSVEIGRAFGESTNEIESPEVDPDGPALWRTLHLELEIVEVLAGEVRDAKNVRVGLAIDGAVDASLMVEGLLAFGELVLFLGTSPVFAYDPDLYWIVGDGALVAEITTTEPVDYILIFLEPEAAAPLQSDERLRAHLRK